MSRKSDAIELSTDGNEEVKALDAALLAAVIWSLFLQNPSHVGGRMDVHASQWAPAVTGTDGQQQPQPPR